MTSTAIGTIDEDYVLYDIEPVAWKLATGPEPVAASYPMRVKDADNLREAMQAKAQTKQPWVTLELNYGGERNRFQKVFVADIQPHSDPYFKRIFLKDRRWPLTRDWISRAFNVTTNLGDKRIAQTTDLGSLDNVPIEIINLMNYKTCGLYPPELERKGNDENLRPWTFKEMIKNVIDGHNKLFEKIYEPILYTLDFDEEIGNLVFEDVVLEGCTKECLDQLLALAPGIAIKLGKTGVLSFANRVDGSEEAVLDKLHQPQEGGGYVIYTDNSLMAPREIHILFTLECEVRFDFDQDTTSNSQIVEEIESRFIKNVAPVPDKTLKTNNGVQLIDGQFATFDDLFSAWGALAPGVTISHETCKMFYVMGGMYEYWAKVGNKDSDQAWHRRVPCVKAHYLTTFQMNPRWMHKGQSWQAKRVALTDPKTGYRLPSPVFVDYSVMVAERAINDTTNKDLFFNVENWAENIKDALPAPHARVSMYDMEQGVFHVNFSPDVMGHYIPFPAKVENAPTLDMTDKSRPHALDEAAENSGLKPSLAKRHQLSTLLTGTPVANNTSNALYEIVIKPDQVKGPAKGRLGKPVGPPLYVRVQPSLETARVAWDDDEEIVNLIEKAFGVGGEPQSFQGLERVIINKKILDELSVAIGSSIYSKFTNRWRGRMRSRMVDVEPAGTISEVIYAIDRGNPVVDIVIAEEINPPSFMNALPRDTRSYLLRQVRS